MRRQGALPLPDPAPAFGRADFLTSACNAAALGWIDRWPDWRGSNTLLLHGPERCGKSHLVELWRARSGATIVAGAALATADPSALAGRRAVAVDDADRAPEEALLHLYNCCRETGASLLILARPAPAAWPIVLPDLASRLRAAPAVAIGPPDDTLLAALLGKHFADRQLLVESKVIDHIVPRMERSFAAVATLADRLDRLALAARGPVTLAIAREALAADQPPSSPSDLGVT